MKAFRVHAHGGADALRYEDTVVPEPAKGEALVKVACAGLNFIDVYWRTGLT
jgi:NADPH2:quinone reductase